jgi:tetratricopeptide (TPR) repeat protein
MKTLSIAILSVLVLLSVAAVLLMLAGVISRVLREKSGRRRLRGSGQGARGQIMPSRMSAEYHGGLEKVRDTEMGELFQKGLSLKQRGRFLEAADVLRECLKKNPTSEQETGLLVTIGSCYLGASEHAQAREHYEKADRLAARSEDEKGRLASLINLGLVAVAERQWDEAIKCYQEAIALERKLGYRKGEAIDLNTLALLHENQGDMDSALAHYGASIEIFRKLKDVEKIELVERNIKRVRGLAEKAST